MVRCCRAGWHSLVQSAKLATILGRRPAKSRTTWHSRRSSASADACPSRPPALQARGFRADMEPPAMRTIGFRSNILFIIAAAVGLLAALGRPWYAPAFVPSGEEARIGDVQGPVEGFFLRLGREFADDGGTKGWDAFTSTDMILVALAAIAVLSAIAALLPGAERSAR